MTVDGITTVARQEFTIRIRAGRWRWLLTAWFVLLAVVTVLIRLVAGTGNQHAADKGVVIYGGLTLLVLGMALLVVPTLSAQSVNGDRERGTLATLQVTRLSAADIALGKFAAAWGTSLVFLALTLPLVLYAMTQGGVPLARVVVVTVVVSLLLGSVIALSLALSSVFDRTTTSGVIAYVMVFALSVGTLVTFGIADALSSQTVTVHDGTQTYQDTRTRPDRVWWLLAPNPFVILADAAPRLPADTHHRDTLRGSDPLGLLGRAARSTRKPPDPLIEDDYIGGYQPSPGPIWPYGLAFDVALGAGALWLTTSQLRTPSRTLPMGRRIA